MRTKIGKYKLKHHDRKRKDWRRSALTGFGLLVNAWISGFFIPVYWLGESEYGIQAAIGVAFCISAVCCIGLYRIRHSTLRESFWISNIPSIIFELSFWMIGFYLLVNILVNGSQPMFLLLLAVIYALPFVYESLMPRPIARPRIFGSTIADDVDFNKDNHS